MAHLCDLAPEQHSSFRRYVAAVSDLTGPRFEPQTSRSRDERVTARPTGRLVELFRFHLNSNVGVLVNEWMLLQVD